MSTALPQNLASFVVAELAACVEGTAFDVDAGARVRGICTDSRADCEGACFVAIVGEAFDGHGFAESAVKKGAVVTIVQAGRVSFGPRIEVRDTLIALGQIAALHLKKIRASRALPVIAVGGAVGKTSTKTMLQTACEAVFGDTLSTKGNLNNRVGVPLTVLSIEAHHKAAVIECGTSEKGEIAKLGAIVNPDVALVLNVDIEHTEGLGTLDDVADEEAALFHFAKQSVVTFAEDERLCARVPASVATAYFGAGEHCDVALVGRRMLQDGYQEVSLKTGDFGITTLRTRLLGEAAAMNIAATMAGLRALARAHQKMLSRDEWERATLALSEMSPVPGRFVPLPFGERGIVLDDTYNANPKSVLAAIASAREIAADLKQPLFVALGDMLELGHFAASAHEEIALELGRIKPNAIFSVGPLYAAAFSKTHTANVVSYENSTTLAATIREHVTAPCVVLVKGSRGMRMERVVEALAGTYSLKHF